MKYYIDVPVYHWDYDHYCQEYRTLTFSTKEKALEASEYLHSLPFEPDYSLKHWSNPVDIRGKGSYSIPRDWDRNDIFEALDLYSGVVIESEFEVYTLHKQKV